MKRYIGRTIGVILSISVALTGMPVNAFAQEVSEEIIHETTDEDMYPADTDDAAYEADELYEEVYCDQQEIYDELCAKQAEDFEERPEEQTYELIDETITDESADEDKVLPDNDLPTGTNFVKKLGTNAAEKEGVAPVSLGMNVKGMLYTVSNSTNLYLYVWSEGGTDVSVPLSTTDLKTYYDTITDIIFEEGITTISAIEAFGRMSSLKTVYFPTTLIKIGDFSFIEDEKLVTVTFTGTALAAIGSKAFYKCGFSSLLLPASVANNASIGESAFAYCSKLTNITISTGFKVIGAYAFSECTALKKIVLPLSVTKIGNSAIDSNYINKVYYEGTGEQWNKIDVLFGNEGWSPSKVVFGIEKVTSISINKDYIMRYSDDLPAGGERVEIMVTLSPAKAMNKNVTATVSPQTLPGTSTKPNPVTIATTRMEADDNGRCTFVVTVKQNGAALIVFSSDDDPTLTASCEVIVKSKEKAVAPVLDSTTGGETATKAVLFSMIDEERHTLKSSTPNTQVFYSTVLSSNTSTTSSSSWKKSGLFTDPDKDGFLHISEAYKNKALEVTDAVTGRDVFDLYYRNLNKTQQDKVKLPVTINLYAIAVNKGDDTPAKNTMSAIAFYKVTYSETIPDVYGDIIEEDREYFDDPSTQIYNPKGVWIPLSQREDESLIYTGYPITIPNLRVYYGKDLLEAERDYTLSYSNNINAAERGVEKAPKVTVKLKGNYTGSKNFDFHIRPKSLAGCEGIDRVTLVQAPYAQDPDLHVNIGGVLLNPNIDYIAEYRVQADDTSTFNLNMIPANALGYFDAKITGIGNYTGIYIKLKAVDVVSAGIDINNVTVSKIPVQYITDPVRQITEAGTGVRLSASDLPQVSYLKQNVPATAYYIGYEQNKAAGTGYLKLIANPEYSYKIGEGDNAVSVRFVGVKYVPFTIKGIPISKVSIKDLNKKEFTNANEREYTGEAIVPTAVLTYNNEAYHLTDDDYDISYSDNIKAGKAKITVTGKGAFYGTTTRTFTITKKYLDACTITVDPQEYDYSSVGIKPVVTVKNGTAELTENVDYTLSYSKKCKAGTYNVSIKPKGSLRGQKITRTYKINPISISDCSVVVSDKATSTKTSSYTQKPVIYDTNGIKLKAGRDYEKEFEYTYAEDTPYYPDHPEKMVKRGGKPVVLVSGTKVEKGDVLPPDVTIRITITGKGNYAGNSDTPAVVSETFRITEKKIKALKFSVSGEYVYSGKRYTPGKEYIEVSGVKTDDPSRLYDIIGYGENIKAGYGTITVRGKGDYGGTAVIKFKILKK